MNNHSMVYDRNSLRENIRKMASDYQVKKELEYYQRNKKTLDKLISNKIFKRTEEILAAKGLEDVVQLLKDIDKLNGFEKLKQN